MDSLEFLRSTNGENNISILRNQVVRVREFAIVFPSTLPYPGRAVDGEWGVQLTVSKIYLSRTMQDPRQFVDKV